MDVWVGGVEALSGGLRPGGDTMLCVAAAAELDLFVFQRPYVCVSGWLSVEFSVEFKFRRPHCSPFRPHPQQSGTENTQCTAMAQFDQRPLDTHILALLSLPKSYHIKQT